MEEGKAPDTNYSGYSDEIDLRELFAKLWANRWWIAFSVVICTVVAICYLFITKPTYEVTAYVRPPLASSSVEVNLSGVKDLQAGEAFGRFRNALMSKELRSKFFNDSEIRSGFFSGETGLTDEQLFLLFDEGLKLTAPDEKKNQVLASDASTLSFQHFSPEFAVTVVNGLIAMADRHSVQDFLLEFETTRKAKLEKAQQRISQLIELAGTKRDMKIEELEEVNRLALQNAVDRLEVLRKKVQRKREDRVEQLKEAISIAEALNIVKPTTLSALTSHVESATSQMAVNTEVSQRDEPLYLRGVEFLSAEREVLIKRTKDDFADPAIREQLGEIELLRKHREVEVLQARQNDEAFIMAQLVPLQDEVARLKNLNIKVSNIAFSRLDQPAVVPKRSIKPNKRFVLIMALLLGGMLGILAAFIKPVVLGGRAST